LKIQLSNSGEEEDLNGGAEITERTVKITDE
jgi:hypothetical protein